MKRIFKINFIVLVMLISLILVNNIAYAKEVSAPPQIETRGITFKPGRSSDQIRLLKDYFRAKEYDNVPWGYNYDKQTKKLVTDFQKIQGLKVTGIADAETLKLINQDIKNIQLNIGLRVPSTNVKGDMILVNTSSNTLHYLKNGQVYKSYPVATGKTAYLTPSGKFTVVVKKVNPAWGGAGKYTPVASGAPNNPLGTRWIGISHGGGGQYGVHGNSNPDSIGSYASMGCIRMFNKDVEEVYDMVKKRTPIWIGSETKLESFGVKFEHQSYYTGEKVKAETPKAEAVNQRVVSTNIRVKLNNQDLILKNPIVNQDGRSYYPFREILEAVKADVMWDEANRTVLGILDDRFVEFQVDSNKYRDVEGYKYLPEGQKVFILNDRTYIPIRYLMESLGFEVKWDQATSTINLINQNQEKAPKETIEETPPQEELVDPKPENLGNK